MKKNILLILSLIVVTTAWCQSPVEWKFTAKKMTDKTYELHFVVTVDYPWHIYSQQSPKGGPLPTKINFAKNPLITLVGKAEEDGDMQRKHEDVFGIDVMFYSEKVDFVQTIKLKTAVKTNATGTIDFMVCNDHECLPAQKIKFTIALQ